VKLRVWKALARGVVLESLRRKDIWVVAILGMVIVLSAGALGFFGFQGLEIFAKDLGISVLGMFSTAIAILTASRLLPEEIKNRTLYPLLARPITRFDLLMGKFIGAIVVSWASFLLLSGLTAVALSIFGVKFEAIMAQYAFCKMMGLVIVCAFSVMFSAFVTPAAAATLSFILAFGSGMMIRALTMAGASSPDAMMPLFKTLNLMLPQTGLFDIGPRVVYSGWSPIPVWAVGSLALYMVCYSAAMMLLSWSKFRRQAI
jgi:ABC-type transport system involved in multi-copper enzyme maturation permease subunit